IDPKTGILGRRLFLSQESIMPDTKLEALRQSRTLHPHPDQVCDPLSSLVGCPSLTHVIWCKSNMNSCDACALMGILSPMRPPCLRSRVQPFTPHKLPGNTLASSDCCRN